MSRKQIQGLAKGLMTHKGKSGEGGRRESREIRGARTGLRKALMQGHRKNIQTSGVWIILRCPLLLASNFNFNLFSNYWTISKAKANKRTL